MKRLEVDAIVVLGGGFAPQGGMTEFARRRIELACGLYKKGMAPRLVLSGGRSILSRARGDITDARAMLDYALAKDVPRSALLLEEESFDTISNAAYVMRRYMRPRGWKKVAIVTSDFHVPRSKFIFKRMLGQGYVLKFYGASSKLDHYEYTRRLHHESYMMLVLEHGWSVIDHYVKRIMHIVMDAGDGGIAVGVGTARGLRWLLSIPEKLAMLVWRTFPKAITAAGRWTLRTTHDALYAVYTLRPKTFSKLMHVVIRHLDHWMDDVVKNRASTIKTVARRMKKPPYASAP